MSTDSNDEGEGELPISGSFFNAVPPPKEESSDNKDDVIENSELENEITPSTEFGNDMEMFEQIIQKTKLSRSDSGKGFCKTTSTTDHAAPSIIQTTSTDPSGEKKSLVGIGKPLNDVPNPKYDEKGYTLYADEVTGEQKRVFEALVEYPSVFKMKIIGKDDEQETFATGMVDVVAKSCGVDTSMVKHTSKKKWKVDECDGACSCEECGYVVFVV